MSNEEQFKHVQQTKEELAKVSPSFCLAKWTQSTIYLHNGRTHSCHHPGAHKIRVEDIQPSPQGLHNTPVKQELRQQMLRGERPSECDYCWRVEDLGTEHLSDRVYKSAAPWSHGRMQEVIDSGAGADFVPSYVEVSFDSTCNFKCVYCLPEVSSRWWEEIEQHGAYSLPSGKKHNNLEWRVQSNCVPIRHDEPNPYKDAFWKVWPEWYQKLHTFRVTGGEPLLSKDLWSVYDYIAENPNPNLEFAINSNLGVPDKLIQKLLASSAAIQGKVKAYTLFTSLEATGPAAEYIRYGMNYQAFVDNVRQVLQATQNGKPLVPRLTFMTTISALSYSTFPEFLTYVLRLRKEFNSAPGRNRIGLSLNYLRYPTFLDIRLLPLTIREALRNDIEALIEEHSDNTRCDLFYLEEIDQLRRLIAYMRSEMPRIEEERADLKDYLRQLDARRGTQVYNVFPFLLYTLPS